MMADRVRPAAGPSGGTAGIIFTEDFEVAVWPSWNSATVIQDPASPHGGTFAQKSYGATYGTGTKKSMGQTVDSSADTISFVGWLYHGTFNVYFRIFTAGADTGYMIGGLNTVELYRCNSAAGFTLLANPSGGAAGWNKYEMVLDPTGITLNLYDATETLVQTAFVADTTYQSFDCVGSAGATSNNAATTFYLDDVSVEIL